MLFPTKAILSVLPLLLATPSAVVADSDTAPAQCYDSTSGFTQSEWTYCQPIRPDVVLYYTPMEDEGNVKIGMHAPAHADGWSALALAGNGGMKGASQFVVRKDESGEWVAEDRFSTDYAAPTLDESQDVMLLFAQQDADEGTSWGIVTPMKSCDDQDYPIEDRQTWMHFAFGYGHEFGYHGSNRGQFTANLLRAPKIDPEDGEGVAQVNMRMADVPVVLGEGGGDPTNPYVCTFFDLEEVKKEHGVEGANQTVHATRFSPYVNPDSAQYVHHMILFSCDDAYAEFTGYEHLKVIPECQAMPVGCWEMKWVWAAGAGDVILPDDVGMPLGGEGGKNRFTVLQMHYFNPSLDEGVIDSSGMTAHITTQLRPIEAGVMQFNGGTVNEQRPTPIPAGQKSYTIQPLVVPSQCTQTWTDTLNIVGFAHHAHARGKNMKIEVERDGKNLGPIYFEPVFDYNHQNLHDPSIRQLLPGDKFEMKCEYDTSGDTEDVDFGDYTHQEMCYAAAMYYPKQPGGDYFEYMPPPADTQEIDEVGYCTLPGTGEYSEVSLCVEMYLTDAVTFVWREETEGYVDVTALDLCNSGIDLSAYCPPCHATASCTAEDVKAKAQEVCEKRCSDAGGLSVYPDTSSTVPSYSHYTMCNLGMDYVLFEPTPFAEPVCEVRGDIGMSKVPPETDDEDGSTPSGSNKQAEKLIGAWAALAAIASLVLQ